jgi:hypothetical protein
MFQYAAARSYSIETNSQLIFNYAFYQGKDYHGFKLDKLSIPDDVEFMKRDTVKTKTVQHIMWNPFLRKIFKSTPEFWTSVFLRSGICMDFDRPGYKPIPVLNYKHNVYLGSYYQSESFFRDHAARIKKELMVSTQPSEENQKILDRLNDTKEESVCLHIRRGDYLNNSYFSVCTEAYYRSAIHLMTEKIKNPVFYVFSDDIEYAKAFCEALPIKTVFGPENNPDFEELRLMYTCKHFIISNSSFSWWAQYLADSPQNTVIAPNRWTSQAESNSIYLDTWNLLDTR